MTTAEETRFVITDAGDAAADRPAYAGSPLVRLYDLPQEMATLADTDEPLDEHIVALVAKYEEYLAELAEEDQRKAIEQQTLRMGYVLKSLASEERQLAEHIALSQARLGAVQKRTEDLKLWLKNLMVQYGIQRAKGALATVYLQNNPPSWNIFDEEAVPAIFKRAFLTMPLEDVPAELEERVTRVEVSKTALDAYLRPACPEGTYYVDDRQHLRVR